MLGIHETLHNSNDICLWTLLAFVVLAVMIIIAIVHIIRQKNRDDRNEQKRETFDEEINSVNGSSL